MRFRHRFHIRNRGEQSQWSGEAGQSTIEYLVVFFCLTAVLLKGPWIYEKISTPIQNKYHSYAFGVAISDPPTKAFDDEIQKDAAKVEHVLEVLEEIEDEIEHAHIPDPSDIHIPKGIGKMWEKITHLF
ncbi:MAG: hypothetical protein R6V18_00135 [Desulfuromonadaceae bacterium]